MGCEGKKTFHNIIHTAMIASYWKKKTAITFSSAFVGKVVEILADTNVGILNVLEGIILVVSVTLLENIAVTSVIDVAAIAVGRICVDIDSVMLVDKTAKIKIGFIRNRQRR